MPKSLFIIPPHFAGLDKEIISTFTAPNIGIAYIAAFMRKYGWDITVIDAEADRIPFSELEGMIKRVSPDIILIGAHTIEIRNAHKVSEIAKSYSEKTPIIIGGPHASAVPKRTLEEFPCFDYAVFGEGEMTTLGLSNALIKAEDISNIRGIAWRDSEGNVVVNSPRRPVKNLESLPFPAFDLFPLGKYRPHFEKENVLEIPISTCRGCRYNCLFCGNRERDVRTRPIENVIEEVEFDIKNYNPDVLHITDPTFTFDRDRVFRFCKEMKNKGLDKKVRWFCTARVDTVDRDMLKMMKSAGCICINYGIESGNQEILEKINKGITIEQATKVSKWMKELVITNVLNFILGLPWETEKSIDDTIDIAMKLDPEFAIFVTLVPFPGTAIERMAENNIGNLSFTEKDWNRYGKETGNSLNLDTVSRKKVIMKQIKAYVKFYGRPHRIKNAMIIFKWKSTPIYAARRLLDMLSMR